MKKFGIVAICVLVALASSFMLVSFVSAEEIDPNNGITEFVLQDGYYYALLLENDYDGNAYMRFPDTARTREWITTDFILQANATNASYDLYVLWAGVTLTDDLQVMATLGMAYHYVMQPILVDGYGTVFNAVYQDAVGLGNVGSPEGTLVMLGNFFGATNTEWDGRFVPGSGYYNFILPVDVHRVNLVVDTEEPYYPGASVQLTGTVLGTGIVEDSPESTLYWYVHGNTSENTYIEGGPYSDVTLHIGNDETAETLEIEAVSTYDTTKSATLELIITYPLDALQIVPSGAQYLTESAKRREIQYNLYLPNGDPYDYQLIEWYAKPSSGHESYYRIDDTGLLVVEPNAPAGSSCTIQFAYQSNPEELSPVGATVEIVTQQEGIYDQLTPTPDQSDKADRLEDAIGDAAGNLENNNSSLEQLTPTRPDINTDLQLDQENLLAVSPLVTNIWSINGMGRMIGIVLMVATVAYIFFGKRDG